MPVKLPALQPTICLQGLNMILCKSAEQMFCSVTLAPERDYYLFPRSPLRTGES